MAKLKREADKKLINKSAGSWLKQHRAECITILFIIRFYDICADMEQRDTG